MVTTSPPSARRQWLLTVLERLDDLLSPSMLGTASGGEGRVRFGPHEAWCAAWAARACDCWLRSLSALLALLQELRSLADGRYRHLLGRYGQLERRRRRGVRYRAGRWEGLAPNEAVLIPRFAAHERGAAERVYEDVLVGQWPAWVELDVVDAALDWLEQRLPSVLLLPRDVAA